MHKTPMHKHVRDNLPRFKKRRKRIKCCKFHKQLLTVYQIEQNENDYIYNDEISCNWWYCIKHVL